ncbi:MAG TPA: error-prone DNA polymerase [Acidimicrobiia bacterium]|nr:error-prone DNA polymerase [Acidimicrobiia bacterium]
MFDIVGRVSRYAELHCHTNFSFLDGASHPEDLVNRAMDLGYEALAVTDHDGFYGTSRLWQAARSTGLPVIYGVEIALEPDPGGMADPVARAEEWDRIRHARSKGGQGRLRRGRSVRAHGAKPTDLAESDHLVLLAGSPDGYRTLSHLVTKAQMRGEKDHPVYIWDDLAVAATNRDVHALTGCRHGAVPKAASEGMAAVVRETTRLREIFGPRAHLELWHHGMPEDDPRNDLLWEVGRKLGMSTLATNQVHYHDRSDAYLSEVLAAVGGRRTLAEADGFRPASDERYLKHPKEMEWRFARYPGAVQRSAELGSRLAFDLALVAPRLPDFPMPGHFRDEMDYLRHLTWEGAREVYPGSEDGIDPSARRRLEHELDIIEKLGFPGYFLVVKDLVDFARDQGIYCQIRGSGADSAVCRCIGLTRVDPIRLHLPFERFLSEERGKPPDIDVDFEADRREEVIQYCYRRYGRERAAMVANVITYRARSVLRDVAKTFGFTQAQVDGLSKYVDTHDPAQLADADVALPRGMTAEMIYDICWCLDGFPRHLGIHSGGMVIADRPLWQVVPLEWGRLEGRTVIQWDKDDSSAVGIVKFDLLGLGMLNALHLSTDLIEDTHGVQVDLALIPQEPAIYESMTRADTVGLFQVESRAQMATLPKMKPKTFYDLAVEVALIRPGPIQGQSVHPYLRRRSGEEPVRYPHPSTEPILEKTLGVPIFQEQLMELARVCAGFDGSQADRLRQAMTHKRSNEAMGRLRDEVYDGMAANGIVGPAADEIWEKLQGFSSFGFPESHSVSFAYIVYMSAWLRFHYPAEYLAGLLNAQPMGFYSPNSLVQDAQRHGVVVRPPCVNVSWHDCTIEPIDADPDDVVSYLGQQWRRGRGHVEDPIRPAVGVRMGLRYVRNLGEGDVTRIEAARILGGEFDSPEDLASRTGLEVRALEGLAASGALESVGLGRREGLWAAGALAEIDPERLPLSPGVDAPTLPGMTEEETHRADLWSTSVSPRHPMSFVRSRLEGCLTAAEALEVRGNRARVKVAGVVTHRQRPATARGVYFLNLEDETGLLNIVVLPDVWARHRHIVRKSPALVIDGRLEYHDGVTNIVARDFDPIGVQTVQSRDFR